MDDNSKPIIGIDLGTTYSCAAIIRNGKVDVIEDKQTGKKTIPSIVCFNNNNEYSIGTKARNNMLQYPQSTMFDSKRLLGHKFSNKYVQKDIKNWPIEVIEDPRSKKPQYVINFDNEEKKYFPEDVSSMILSYIKTYAETFENNEIKKVVIGVPAHFNNLQRDATIEAAKEAGFEDIKLINEPTAAAIAYGNIIKSDKERKVLIFDLGGGTFDVSIVKIKGNEYNVLASLGEEHLGGEDFNQRIIEYVKKEIKNDKKFKDIDFNNKDDKIIIKALNKIKIRAEKVKIELSSEEYKLSKKNICLNQSNDNKTNNKTKKEVTSSFFIDYLNGNDDFELEITRSKYEELCMDLWNKCLIKVDEALKKAKLKKEEINEIILVGGSTRTPKIKQMVQEYFNKKPLQNINPDEVVAYGAILFSNKDNILKINDIISKSIGVSTKGGEMSIIIPEGTVIPLRKNYLVNCEKKYNLHKNENMKNQITIKIYEGNRKLVKDNIYLGEFVINFNKDKKEMQVKLSMSIDDSLRLKVIGEIIDGEKNGIKIQLFN